jgi:hypothetical protein
MAADLSVVQQRWDWLPPSQTDLQRLLGSYWLAWLVARQVDYFHQ